MMRRLRGSSALLIAAVDNGDRYMSVQLDPKDAAGRPDDPGRVE